MKKHFKVFAILLAFSILIAGFPENAFAASKNKITVDITDRSKEAIKKAKKAGSGSCFLDFNKMIELACEHIDVFLDNNQYGDEDEYEAMIAAKERWKNTSFLDLDIYDRINIYIICSDSEYYNCVYYWYDYDDTDDEPGCLSNSRFIIVFAKDDVSEAIYEFETSSETLVFLFDGANCWLLDKELEDYNEHLPFDKDKYLISK
ncbi:MAG: hypothetical protein K6E56_00595 [Lachnospiraceae bacterium]|nr:hypothetical protein [Lachnospiraceae bacterium]